MSTIGKSVGDATPASAYNPVVLVDPATGAPVGGGGGGGEVTVTNWPATQPVSGTVTATGPITNAQFTAVSGAATAAAWDGIAASATLVAILKAIHAQNATMIGLLNDIKTNTAAA